MLHIKRHINMHPLINKFIHDIIDAFHRELPTPRTEKCVFTSRDEVATIMRMCELEGTFIIRPYTYAGGETNYHLIQLFN